MFEMLNCLFSFVNKTFYYPGVDIALRKFSLTKKVWTSLIKQFELNNFIFLLFDMHLS